MRVNLALRAGAVAAALVSCATLGAASGARQSQTSASRDNTAATTAALSVYYRQSVTWSPCQGSSDPLLQCATVKVPLDYSTPAKRSITLAVDRLASPDPSLRHGVLLTNPGGPGGSGLPTPEQLRGELPASVVDAYDIIGFDPRFIGHSTPISCGQPAEDLGGIWIRWPHPGSFDGDVAAARQRAAACEANAGWALPYATTANTARDMDVIRAVLGAPRMSFFGTSYGAYLGAVYTALFPNRTDRFVLESPVNPDQAWYRFQTARAGSLEIALDEFCVWVAARDGTYHFGTTGQAVRDTWNTLTTQADAHPITTPDGLVWTGDLIRDLSWILLYNDKNDPVLAADLAAVRAGQSVPFPPPPTPQQPAGVPADNNTASYLAIICGDAPWPRDPAVYRAGIAAESVALPFLGAEQANITPCAFWPFRQQQPVSLSGDHARNVLIVDSTRDPATPYAGSLLVHADIPGSRLVTLDAAVHVPYPTYGDTCTNNAVNAYLATGVLPSADLFCAGIDAPVPG
jgi:pimeloyl-ACP methyl ester carboxylesterase